jgi:hypothetical protein
MIRKILYAIEPRIYYEYKNNRRYCKKCRQRQDLFSTNYSDCKNKEWWENMGEIFDKYCKCHSEQKYLSSYDILIF